MKAIITILILVSSITVNAQRICGSLEYTAQLLKSNPSLQNSFNKVEKEIGHIKTGRNAGTGARGVNENELISIPVVIHVLYKSTAQNISDAQILSQMVALNNDYSYQNDDKKNAPTVFAGLATDTRIKFCLAQVDPNGNRTNGIIRKHTTEDRFLLDDAIKTSAKGGDDAWDNTKYLNVWVGRLSGSLLGYATPPGAPANLDGLVISYDAFGTTGTAKAPYNKGRTATHEIGHWLGLVHLWGDTQCGEDGVDDTPKQKSYNVGSPVFPHVTTCSPNAYGDMFMNFMDYTDDATMNMFTVGQKARMRALFADGNVRNSFLSSSACDSNLASAPAPALQPVTLATATASTFSVYPNPVQSTIHIEFKTTVAFIVKSIHIFNANGLLVYKGQMNKEKMDINLSNLANGVYIIKVTEGTTAFTKKLVKQ